MALVYYYSMFGIRLAMSPVYVFIFHKHFARIAVNVAHYHHERWDGMEKHFDKRLEKFYILARPRLEEYYRKLDS